MESGWFKLFFWVGVIMIAQAGAFVPVSGPFPALWLYSSIGVAVCGVILLLLLRAMQRRDVLDGDEYIGPHDVDDY